MVQPTQAIIPIPFTEYNSNASNRITRSVSGSSNCISINNPIISTELTSTSLQVSAGRCFKDDVSIEISQTSIDCTDDTNYANSLANGFTEDGYHYLVLDYTYSKVRPAPTASIVLIAPSQSLYTTDDYILLKVVEVASSAIVKLYDYDPNDTSVIIQIPDLEDERVVSTSESNYEIGLLDDILFVDTEHVYLHTALIVKEHIIVNDRTSGNVIIHIESGSSDTIEGVNEILISGQNNLVKLMSDGIDLWFERR